MNVAGISGALVVLTVAPALEEPMIDWLLGRADGGGFTTQPVAGHSSRHDGLSTMEQVTGRQRRIQFQVQIGGDALAGFLDDARAVFGGADVHFWVLPILEGGRLGESLR